MEHEICFGWVLCLLLAIGAKSLPTTSPENLNSDGTPYQRAIWPFTPDDYNSTVLFFLYTKSTLDNGYQLWKDDVTALKSSDFDVSRKKTLVLMHGYWDILDSAFDNHFKDALLKYEDVNVIAIDWSYYTRNINYYWVVTKVKGVGTFIGDFIGFLMDQTGLSPDQVHLIGHSIGAHASGFAAKTLKAEGRTVARVSGLDPAWPGFWTAKVDERLSSRDAKFVDCIHSCGGGLGYPSPICQADFFPNGGIHVQPGCPRFDFGVCSHGRSFDYYAESIQLTHVFEAQTCNSIVDGVPYDCENRGAVMGYPATDKFLGQFYLTTWSNSPFAKNITTSPS